MNHEQEELDVEREDVEAFSAYMDKKNAPTHGKRRAAIESALELARVTTGFDGALNLARTLADEVDTLTAENERIRQNHGCARHQHTTQFCAEAAERDAVITRLLDTVYNTADRDVYARACEIAGRKPDA